MKNRDSFKDPYLIKQINSNPTNIKGGYAELLVDNTEKDIVIVWSDQPTDPQVIHIQRDKLNEFIDVLNHCKKGKDKIL